MSTDRGALAVDHLTIAFGSGESAFKAVDDIGFAVAPGEAYGIIGESGSGKSTVLRAISGLNLSYEGSIRVDGKELPRPRSKDVFKRVQMVFQDPYGSLHPRRLIRSTLMEPLAIHRIDGREERIDTALREVGLDPGFAHRYPHQLSGGQRQRVAIARCLLLEPEILLLDEPTSALDVSVQAGVLNLLDALRTTRGLTYVLVTHDLRVVAHMCERIAVMNGGRIVEEITADDVRAGEAREPYTNALMASSRGARREARVA